MKLEPWLQVMLICFSGEGSRGKPSESPPEAALWKPSRRSLEATRKPPGSPPGKLTGSTPEAPPEALRECPTETQIVKKNLPLKLAVFLQVQSAFLTICAVDIDSLTFSVAGQSEVNLG